MRWQADLGKRDAMKQLLLSIHDVSPRHTERLGRIDALLDRLGLANRYSYLVVPDFWGAAPLAQDPDFQAWLAAKEAQGVEMILHGFHHRDTSQHSGLQQFKARHLTASEGEFLGLTAGEANALMQRGRDILAGFLRQPVQGFIAPAWLYGDGARTALVDQGFAFAEDHWQVWAPNRGNAQLLRGPVISYASRSRARMASSLVWSRLAAVLLYGQQTVRLAIHPHDFDKPVLIKEIERTIRGLLRHRTPVRYDCWLATRTAA